MTQVGHVISFLRKSTRVAAAYIERLCCNISKTRLPRFGKVQSQQFEYTNSDKRDGQNYFSICVKI